MQTYLGLTQRTTNGRWLYGRCKNYRLNSCLMSLVNYSESMASIDPTSGDVELDVDGIVEAATPGSLTPGIQSNWPAENGMSVPNEAGGIAVQNSGYARTNGASAITVTKTWDWGTGDTDVVAFGSTTAYTYENTGDYTAQFTGKDALGRTTYQPIDVAVGIAVPANLGVTPGDTENVLNWDDADADTYSVYRSLVEGGPYTLVVADLVVSNYTNTGLTNGTEYFYVVTATQNGLESGYSDEASGTPEL